MGVLHDPELERLLGTLHAQSDAQVRAIRDYYDERTGTPPEDEAARTKTFLSDKLVALDRDKAEFCYQICRAKNARRIVEVGTSYGSRRSILPQRCATIFVPWPVRAS